MKLPLKPCHLCGGESYLKGGPWKEGRYFFSRWVYCRDCRQRHRGVWLQADPFNTAIVDALEAVVRPRAE